MGAIVFLSIFGYKVLNPFNDAWLCVEGDLSQTYFGWLFFKNAEWRFPVGVMDNVCYEQNMSVIYLDCIPIMSLLFKIFSFALPETFQWIGFYWLLCFMLNGGVGAVILNKYTKNLILSFLGSLFFILTYPTLFRIFIHMSLTSQYILLLAFCTIIFYDKISNLKKSIVIWGIIAFYSMSVHIYFFAMCTIVFLGFILKDFLYCRQIKRVVKFIGYYILIAFGTLIFWGTYENGGIINFINNTSALEIFSSNLNSLYNPIYGSYFFQKCPILDGQYEGSSYLGLGGIILTIIAFILSVKNYKQVLKEYKVICPVVVVFIIAFIISLSPQITLGEKILFRIDYPDFFIRMWQNFRSTGRIIWICVYSIYIGSFYFISKNLKPKISTIIIIGCLVLQIIDYYPFLSSLHNMEYIESYAKKLDSSFWEDVVETQNINKILFLSYGYVGKDEPYISISELAYRNKLDVSFSFFSRNINYLEVDDKIRETLSSEEAVLKDAIYVFRENEVAFFEYPLNYYCIDGLVVGVKNEVEGYEKYNIPNRYEFMEEKNCLSEYSDKVLKLYNLPIGEYEIKLKGNSLANLEVSINLYNDGNYSDEKVLIDNENYILHVENYEFSDRLEIVLRNLSDSIIDFESISIEKIN